MMKKKNPKDKLEDLFGGLFNDSRKIQQPAGWNVPSEDVWDNIQKELAPEKKRERKFVYWQWVAVAASVLLLLCVFQLYQSNQQIQGLSKQLAENDQAVQKIQADLQALNEQKTKRKEQINAPIKETLNSSINTNITNSITETTAFNNVNAAFKSFDAKFVSPSSPNKALGEATFESGIALVSVDKQKKVNRQNSDSNESLSKKEIPLNTVSLLEKLPISIHQLGIDNRTINWKNLPLIPKLKKRLRFYLAADYAPILTTVKDKGAKLDQHEFFPRRETQETAFTTGLQFGLKWSKGWSLETGLRYSSINKRIQHNRIIPYQSLQERLNNSGEYESNLNLQLGSAQGAIDTDISLARSAVSTVASNAKINMDITFNSNRNYLDIPLSIKKEWAIGSFALSLKAGLLNRFLLTKNFELQEITLNDSRFNSRTNNFGERPNTKSSTNYAVHCLAGVGLAYTFQSNLSFYLEPTFIRSMQPVIGPRGASIYTKNKMLNVGFRYML